jgi:catechol 2,3-dioxygenase-like lactoylglutathione lyase family enzyme
MDLGWFEVSLNVEDIARSVAFYETLGFKVASGSVATRDVTLQKADCRLALYEGHLDPARPQLIFWQGDVPAIARDLTEKGLQFHRPPASDSRGTGAMLLDPDGHPIYFVNIHGVTRKDPAGS